MNRWEMQKKITENVKRDAKFIKKLSSSPKETLTELFKGEVDASYWNQKELRIVEEKKDELVIAIPYFAPSLPDRRLEKVMSNPALGGSTSCGSCDC